MRFTNMQDIGNDFILIDGRQYPVVDDPGALARRMCDRHFGVGADGLIWMVPSRIADTRMRIFNSDGTEPEMCGNGLRCAARFVHELGVCPADVMTVETLAGVLTVRVEGRFVTADMGEPCFAPDRIPVAAPSNRVTIDLDGQPTAFFCASMGNPHAVTFDLYPDDAAFRRLGPMLERHALFPARTNVEFCRVRDGGVDVRVWERGDGETLACGTGACAVLTAAATQGLTDREADIRLPGGVLHIRWAEDNHLFMRGPADVVYEGDYPV